MSELDAHALAVEVPAGWEGRIFRRAEAGEARMASAAVQMGVPAVAGASAPPGEKTMPLVHLATVPLPHDAADYGAGIVETLGAGDAFVVLKEFDAAEAGEAIFEREGIPRDIDPDVFDPAALQRRLPNQAGTQVFFHEASRAFCLYAVLGDYARRHEVVPRINEVLATVRIEPRVQEGPTD